MTLVEIAMYLIECISGKHPFCCLHVPIESAGFFYLDGANFHSVFNLLKNNHFFQILSRRGLHRSLFSATRKWFGGSKPAGLASRLVPGIM